MAVSDLEAPAIVRASRSRTASRVSTRVQAGACARNKADSDTHASRFPARLEHLSRRRFHSDRQRASDDAVADIELDQLRYARDRADVVERQSVARIDDEPLRVGVNGGVGVAAELSLARLFARCIGVSARV